MWVLLMLPRFGGAKYANDHDHRSRYCEVGLSGGMASCRRSVTGGKKRLDMLYITNGEIPQVRTAKLGCVLPRRGSLHLDFGDIYPDYVADGDKSDEPVAFHHGHVAAGASSLSDISRLIVSASRAVTLRSGYGRSSRHPRRRTQVPRCEASAD